MDEADVVEFRRGWWYAGAQLSFAFAFGMFGIVKLSRSADSDRVALGVAWFVLALAYVVLAFIGMKKPYLTVTEREIRVRPGRFRSRTIAWSSIRKASRRSSNVYLSRDGEKVFTLALGWLSKRDQEAATAVLERHLGQIHQVR